MRLNEGRARTPQLISPSVPIASGCVRVRLANGTQKLMAFTSHSSSDGAVSEDVLPVFLVIVAGLLAFE